MEKLICIKVECELATESVWKHILLRRCVTGFNCAKAGQVFLSC